MTPGADDLIGLSEAERLSGRSARTIRRWIAAGRLRDLRPPGHEPAAPIALRAGDLRALLASESPAPRGAHAAPPATAGATPPPAADAEAAALRSEVAALRERIADLQDALEDARRSRDRALSEAAELRAALTETRRALDAAHRATLELATAPRDTSATADPAPTLAGRVRGLLRSVF
jgi:hypothetical protein